MEHDGDAHYEEFLRFHQSQLNSIGFPEELTLQLYQKLHPEEIFDAGNSFIFASGGDPRGKTFQ